MWEWTCAERLENTLCEIKTAESAWSTWHRHSSTATQTNCADKANRLGYAQTFLSVWIRYVVFATPRLSYPLDGLGTFTPALPTAAENPGASTSAQGYLAHKKLQTPQDHHRTLGVGLLQGPTGGRVLIIEVPP